MPTRGKDWPARVKAKAVALWRRAKRRGMTRQLIADELNRFIQEKSIDTDGRVVTVRLVKDWTEGIPQDDELWIFSEASPEECELVAKVYAYARLEDGPEAWPTRAEARWWARMLLLAPEWSFEEVYETGLYAATRSTAEQRQIGADLMYYHEHREELRRGTHTPNRMEPNYVPNTGGTANVAKEAPLFMGSGGAAVVR